MSGSERLDSQILSKNKNKKKWKDQNQMSSETVSAIIKKDVYAAECAFCAITETVGGIVLRKCTRCNLSLYCSKECQKEHWIKGGHKKFCLPPNERNPLLYVSDPEGLKKCRNLFDMSFRT